MKHVAKLLCVLLTLSLLLTGTYADAVPTVRVAAFSGPTGMGMAKLMEEDSLGEADLDYEFTVAGSPDQVVGPLAKGDLDIACLPANLASVLWNNTDGAVTVLAINTLGVIYVLAHDDSVATPADLAGRTLYASGKGSTPEYALHYILTENGVDPERDLTVEWKSEHAEALAAFMADPNSCVMLPQPFVSVAQTKAQDAVIALDLTHEWEALQTEGETGTMITGVVVARTAFVQEHPDLVEAFLAEYADSVAYVNDNIPEGAQLIGKHGIVEAAVAEKALPYCNIVCLTGAELKEKLGAYLDQLYLQNPASVGGTVPEDAFYYGI